MKSIAINIIDRVMGSGKSTEFFIEAQRDKKRKVIFCSEFLTELKRAEAYGFVQPLAGRPFIPDGTTIPTEQDKLLHQIFMEELCELSEAVTPVSPQNTKGLPQISEEPLTVGSTQFTKDDRTKTEIFAEMLQTSNHIAITHSLFHLIIKNQELLDMIQERGFHVVVDETFEVIKEFTEVTWNNLVMLVANNHFRFDDNNFGKVHYLGNDADPTESVLASFFRNISNLYSMGSSRRVFFHVLPCNWVAKFKSVTVLTYNFAGSILASWANFHNITIHIKRDPLGDRKIIAEAAKRIVVNHDYDKAFSEFKLTKTGFEKATQKQLSKYSRLLSKVGMALVGAEGKHRFGYTFPKGFCGTTRKGIYPKGYAHSLCHVRTEPAIFPENQMPENLFPCDYSWKGDGQREARSRYHSAHIVQNSRGTNDYSNKTVMLLGLDINMNPVLKQWLLKLGVEVDEDVYALNQMLQWFWRSSIRLKETSEPVTFIFGTERMEKLFNEWFERGIGTVIE